MSLATRSAGQIPITRFHDSEGRPTCCLLWGSKADTCPLLRIHGLSAQEICNWTETSIERRDNYGLLIPVEGCPVHPGHREEAPWLDIRTAPSSAWIVCRNANRTVFEARKGEAGLFFDRQGGLRDPVEWCRVPG